MNIPEGGVQTGTCKITWCIKSTYKINWMLTVLLEKRKSILLQKEI